MFGCERAYVILGGRVTALQLAPGSRCALANYRARASWIDPRDLAQEAALAALTAEPRWEARAVALALSQFVASARSPVHVPDSRGAEGTPTRAAWVSSAFAGCAPLTVPGDFGRERDSPEMQAAAMREYLPIEDAIDTARAVAKVRSIIAEQYEAARAVLLEEEKSSAVARRLGVSVRKVYDDTRRGILALQAALGVEETA